MKNTLIHRLDSDKIDPRKTTNSERPSPSPPPVVYRGWGGGGRANGYKVRGEGGGRKGR